MNPKIRTYEDLLEEEKRLLAILKGHENLMRQDFVGVRQGLKPVGNAFNFVSKLSTRDQTGPFANFGLEFGLDLLLRRFLLARAGWFTKIAIPYLVKNYASHIITEEKRDALIARVNSWMQKFRPKPPASAEYSAQDVDPRFYRPGFTGSASTASGTE
ncbi:hypothetical protein SAMN05444008_11498 [Cnuella takakiae]|uniref:Uncharacterized protein n=1 Tax=Cnuella takakiae TaxID=1302690 RepID=A0A1M5FP71_9BACT|nr:hypothetical protein [Cnuella takakiae]OLY93686.1 hypothetical protein BUE76_18720 [Cnuella takakiae]SHF93340.1 hypothetical protein SAMN05444008_11498 [Cnuella takakiae]